MLTALFGIEGGSLNLAVNLLILVLVLVWLALVYWTWADARRRLSDPVLVGTATIASLVPFIGTIVYTILRPPEFLADARERELEVQASELRLRHLTAQSCPRCEHPIERVWLRCPECQQRLKDPCRSCSRPVDPRWSICPYCETPMASAQGQRRRGRGGSGREESAERSRSEPGADPARSEGRRRQTPAERVSQRTEKGSKPSSASGSEPEGSAPGSRRRSTTTS